MYKKDSKTVDIKYFFHIFTRQLRGNVKASNCAIVVNPVKLIDKQ